MPMNEQLAVFETDVMQAVPRDGETQGEIFIRGNENALYEHPAVLAAAVVAQPHEKWGEVPKAFVELKEGCTATEPEIIDFCRQHLADFKTPESVEFVELPKTSTGKIQKFLLRAKARANT